MGEADIAGIARGGVHWELTFEGDEGFRPTVKQINDVIRVLEAQKTIIALDDTGCDCPEAHDPNCPQAPL